MATPLPGKIKPGRASLIGGIAVGIAVFALWVAWHAILVRQAPGLWQPDWSRQAQSPPGFASPTYRDNTAP